VSTAKKSNLSARNGSRCRSIGRPRRARSPADTAASTPPALFSRPRRLDSLCRPAPGRRIIDLAWPSITMILGERKLPLTRAEASELHDLLVERNLALLALQSELARALQADSGQPDVLADEEMRKELLLCLDTADAEHQLAEGLRSLRQAARVPLSPKPEY